MGACYDSTNKMDQTLKPAQLALPIVQKHQIDLTYDERSPMLATYIQNQNIFEKKSYNWWSIPLISKIDISKSSYFQVKNIGITNDNFVVGIIKKEALISNERMPWKTSSVICYESHNKKGDSGIIFDNKLSRCGREVRNGQIITIAVTRETIYFKIGKEVLGTKAISSNFFNDEILPYVALFSAGDKVEFPSGVKPSKSYK